MKPYYENILEFGTDTPRCPGDAECTGKSTGAAGRHGLHSPDGVPGSLRDAISNAINNEIITFDPGVNGTLTLTSGPYDIRTNLTIQGPGAKALTVNAKNQSRVFNALQRFNRVVICH